MAQNTTRQQLTTEPNVRLYDAHDGGTFIHLFGSGVAPQLFVFLARCEFAGSLDLLSGSPALLGVALCAFFVFIFNTLCMRCIKRTFFRQYRSVLDTYTQIRLEWGNRLKQVCLYWFEASKINTRRRKNKKLCTKYKKNVTRRTAPGTHARSHAPTHAGGGWIHRADTLKRSLFLSQQQRAVDWVQDLCLL